MSSDQYNVWYSDLWRIDLTISAASNRSETVGYVPQLMLFNVSKLSK